MDAISGHFLTDLSFAEIKDLSSVADVMDLDNAKQVSITDPKDGLLVSTFSTDGQWILVPQAGIGKHFEIQDFIADQLKQ